MVIYPRSVDETVHSFSCEAWLLHQGREEVVDDCVRQEIVADIVLRWFVMNLRQLIRMVESSGFLRKQIDSPTGAKCPPPQGFHNTDA